jgi:predicted SAM-dependent methyltransferase
MAIRTRLRRALEIAHLDGISRKIVRGVKRMSRDFTRGSGIADKRIIERYFGAHPVTKLHVGCGPNVLDGWLNADRCPASPLVLRLDATKPFALGDETFDYVFSEHMIEHLTHSQGHFMLAECFRILKHGGIVRISTPDLAFLVDLYRDDKTGLQQGYLRWSAAHFLEDASLGSDTLVINNFVRDWGHQFIYDEKTLRSSMERAGFAEITRHELQESENETLRNLENEARMPDGFLRLETFTLEGTKSPASR